MQRTLQLLSNEGRKTGLVIKKEKTKTMVFGSPVIKNKLKVDGQDVENVTEFVYLGSLMTYDGSCSKDTGWPKKVSHYRESSLNRIKNRQPG